MDNLSKYWITPMDTKILYLIFYTCARSNEAIVECTKMKMKKVSFLGVAQSLLTENNQEVAHRRQSSKWSKAG